MLLYFKGLFLKKNIRFCLFFWGDILYCFAVNVPVRHVQFVEPNSLSYIRKRIGAPSAPGINGKNFGLDPNVEGEKGDSPISGST